MKDTEEKGKFDAVNKDITGAVMDVSSTIKRKRNDESECNNIVNGNTENKAEGNNKIESNQSEEGKK